MADTLEYWQIGTAEPVPADYLDWGASAPGSSADRQFRVFNQSQVYTAHDVTLAVSDWFPDPPLDPPPAAMHLFSTDGETFTATAALGDLSPREASAPVTLRRVIPAAMPPGAFTVLITAIPASWAQA